MSRVYLARKNDAPVDDDNASHIIAIIENSYFGAVTEAKRLNASIVAAHDMGDAGYQLHQGPDSEKDGSIKKLATAVVAAILANGNVSGASSGETAVESAKAYVDTAWKA